MSDRREAVARAIRESASTRTPYNNWLNMADAAIAAMQDAEPTGDELTAAMVAYRDAVYQRHPDDHEYFIVDGQAMHAALIAVRKAGQ